MRESTRELVGFRGLCDEEGCMRRKRGGGEGELAHRALLLLLLCCPLLSSLLAAVFSVPALSEHVLLAPQLQRALERLPRATPSDAGPRRGHERARDRAVELDRRGEAPLPGRIRRRRVFHSSQIVAEREGVFLKTKKRIQNRLGLGFI